MLQASRVFHSMVFTECNRRNLLITVALTSFVVNGCEGHIEPDHFVCRNVCNNSRTGVTQAIPPMDCSELPAGSTSGVYIIQPNGSHPYSVYCDMRTDGGGWTVFQRRQDGTVDFYRNWTDYENGFGSVSGEHWLGNAKISELTKQKNCSLRVDMKDFEGSSNYTVYDAFKTLSQEKYTVMIGNYQGQAGDSMRSCNGIEFSTKDRDNDRRNAAKCAIIRGGGWWYKTCGKANLNGRYKPAGFYNQSEEGPNGIEWFHWKGQEYSLAFTEMKLRPN